MNKIIKQELLKLLKSVDIDFNDDTTSLYIPKVTEIKSSSVKVGEYYKVELCNKDAIANVNIGRSPKNNIYNVVVIQIIGNIIKLNGVAENDPSDNWYGYVSDDCIKVLEKE